MQEIIKLYSNLLKHPKSQKSYEDIRDFYLSIGKIEEANAFDQLIKTNYQVPKNE